MRNILWLSIVVTLGCNKMNEPEYPLPPSPLLEEVFSDNTYQLTGIAVSKEGRRFTNYPFWSDVYKYAVVEIQSDSLSSPYPNLLMNTDRSSPRNWICVQAVHVDDSNRLWVVDPAAPKMKSVVGRAQKLVQINLGTNAIQREYPLAGVTDDGSYINDVRVDVKTQTAYLTNSTEGGIVVVDLPTGKARQLLQGTSSVIADPGYILTIDGHPIRKNGAPFRSNSDGIALTPDGRYLYYKPLTDDKLYRIRTDYLRDTAETNLTLSPKVEYLGRFTTTDGMIFDRKGNLYLGDLERYRIVKIDSQRQMSVVVEDKRLIWPDSYQVTDDGYLYVSCSQIHKQPEYNDGEDRRTTPYKIYRIKLN